MRERESETETERDREGESEREWRSNDKRVCVRESEYLNRVLIFK